MKVKDYVQKYKLQERENIQFDNNGLLEDLNKDFENQISLYTKNAHFTYEIFHNLVKQINQKFWAISNKRLGNSFSREYWNAFYAKFVLRKRALLFPEIHNRLEVERKSREEKEKS